MCVCLGCAGPWLGNLEWASTLLHAMSPKHIRRSEKPKFNATTGVHTHVCASSHMVLLRLISEEQWRQYIRTCVCATCMCACVLLPQWFGFTGSCLGCARSGLGDSERSFVLLHFMSPTHYCRSVRTQASGVSACESRRCVFLCLCQCLIFLEKRLFMFYNSVCALNKN